MLFGHDQVLRAHGGHRPEELIIVEGEMDVLALREAGAHERCVGAGWCARVCGEGRGGRT